jgi:hypothetical protein
MRPVFWASGADARGEKSVREEARPGDRRELIRRVAAHPHGLGFLHLADLESVAVTLRVDPFVVAGVRAELETPAGRSRLIEEVRLARLDRSGTHPDPANPAVPPQPRPPLTARELIRAAQVHPCGPSFLVDGYWEVVAVTFQVHPDLVFRARGIIARRERMKAAHPGR